MTQVYRKPWPFGYTVRWRRNVNLPDAPPRRSRPGTGRRAILKAARVRRRRNLAPSRSRKDGGRRKGNSSSPIDVDTRQGRRPVADYPQRASHERPIIDETNRAGRRPAVSLSNRERAIPNETELSLSLDRSTFPQDGRAGLHCESRPGSPTTQPVKTASVAHTQRGWSSRARKAEPGRWHPKMPRPSSSRPLPLFKQSRRHFASLRAS